MKSEAVATQGVTYMRSFKDAPASEAIKMEVNSTLCASHERFSFRETFLENDNFK